MKNIIMLFLIVFLFGTSCQEKNNRETIIDSVKENIDVRSIRTKGEIPYETNPELKSLLKNPENHTWEELDHYYRTIALKTMTEEDYFMSLQNIVFKRLVTNYNFLELAPIETVEFYIEDQRRVTYNAFPRRLAKALNVLKDTWSAQQIKDYVDENLKKTHKYIYETINNPNDFIRRSKKGHDYLREFSKSLQLPGLDQKK